jgi:uncharacterized protein YlxW (UPF0749 family)
VTDESATGDPVTGEPLNGEPVLGEPVLGEPVLGEPVLGEPVLGEPVPGENLTAEEPGGPDETAEAAAAPEAGAVDSETADADVVARESAGEPAEGFDDPDPAPVRRSWAALFASTGRSRLTGAGLVIALLVGLLGFGLIAQVKSNANESTLATDRPEDLVRILADLDARKDRLNDDITALRETQQQLNSGVAGKQAAIDEARKRAAELGILAGTLPAQGPGLRITLEPDTSPVSAYEVLITVESLRGAGAEAMSISGSGGAVRIVASTYFVDAPDGVNVGGAVLGGPLTIDVIGNPQGIQTALNIPGEVVDSVHRAGGNVLIVQLDVVRVTALHSQAPFRYARPVA